MKSKEVLRDEFIQSVESYVDYWATQRDITDKARCKGLAFSLLNLLDGMSSNYPYTTDLLVSLNTETGLNGVVINDDVMLHELLK